MNGQKKKSMWLRSLFSIIEVKLQKNVTLIIPLSFLGLSLFFQVLDADALLVGLMSCQTLRANNGVSWKWSTLSPSSPAVSQVASGCRVPPAMTGRSSSLSATPLQYFLPLIGFCCIFPSVLPKDKHLYFVEHLQPCHPIGGNERQMIVWEGGGWCCSYGNRPNRHESSATQLSGAH